MKNLYLIIGASGCGKTTAQTILERIHQLDGVQSYTTRPPRTPKETGHIFVDGKTFDSLTDLVAYTEYNGYRYGITERILKRADFYVIDPPGAMTLLRHKLKPMHVIWLEASEAERMIRMLNRGDSVDESYERVKLDRATFSDKWKKRMSENFDGFFEINTDDRTPLSIAQDIRQYIQKEG